MQNSNTKNSTKKKIGILAALLAMAILTTASFAYFTDTASVSASTKAGTLAIGLTADGGLEGQLANKDFANEIQNLNPGDSRTVEYKINNVGNKAMYAQDTITLTVTPDAAYGGSFASADDCKITLGGATLDKASSGYKDGAFTLVYKGAEAVLSGTGDSAEVVAAHTGTDATRAYTLTFAQDADNVWQNAAVSMSVEADAMQYANVSAGTLANTNVSAETVKTDAAGTIL